MDQILAKASNQAVTFAIRSGISLASGYAIKRISSFVEKLPDSERKRIVTCRNQIQTKIDILTVSIDLIKLAAARGNTTLESTISLIDELHEQFDKFDQSMDTILEQLSVSNERELIKKVESYMKDLLNQINDAIPIITLSLATSGVNLRGELLANKFSPGRLIQASSHIITSKGNTLGPTFDLVMYTVFYNPDRIHNTDDKLSAITWKETFARCKVKIVRNKGFNCSIQIEEDFNDGRYHDEAEDKPQTKTYDIGLIQSMFFSASGKLLRLESRKSSVLVVKLRDGDNEEWFALGEQNIGEFDSEDEEEEDDDDDDNESKNKQEKKQKNEIEISNSLSLLEYILRLAKVQQIENKSILEIKDEILSLYLHDEGQTSEITPSLQEKRVQKARKEGINTKVTLDSNINRLQNLDITE